MIKSILVPLIVGLSVWSTVYSVATYIEQREILSILRNINAETCYREDYAKEKPNEVKPNGS